MYALFLLYFCKLNVYFICDDNTQCLFFFFCFFAGNTLKILCILFSLAQQHFPRTWRFFLPHLTSVKWRSCYLGSFVFGSTFRFRIFLLSSVYFGLLYYCFLFFFFMYPNLLLIVAIYWYTEAYTQFPNIYRVICSIMWLVALNFVSLFLAVHILY